MERRALRALARCVAKLRPSSALCAQQKFAMAKAEHRKAMRGRIALRKHFVQKSMLNG